MQSLLIGLILAVSLALAACQDSDVQKESDPMTGFPTAQLILGEKGAGSGLVVSGMPYRISQPGKPALSGVTDNSGLFSYRTGDTITFYLDDAQTLSIAEASMAVPSPADVYLLSQISFGASTSAPTPQDINRLAALLLALDAKSDAGIQLIGRQREVATTRAVGILAALKSDLPASADIAGLLAALDDPATLADEGKTIADLPSLKSTVATLGLYPFANEQGDVCTGGLRIPAMEPTPGCTFFRDGGRISAREDPDYNRYGSGEADMWRIQFDSSGAASAFDESGQFQYMADVSDFAGFIAGTTIGVGVSGSYWENVADGMYWMGRSGVLYSANASARNYRQAIN